MYKDVTIKLLLSVSIIIWAAVTSSSIYGVELVTHPSVKLDHMTTQQLRRVYAKRQLQWESGQIIVVYVLPAKSPTHQQFTLDYLHLFPYQLNRIWHRLSFSGVGTAPIVVYSQAEMLAAVKNTPGAIGYVENVPKDYAVNIVQMEKDDEL